MKQKNMDIISLIQVNKTLLSQSDTSETDTSEMIVRKVSSIMKEGTILKKVACPEFSPAEQVFHYGITGVTLLEAFMVHSPGGTEGSSQ